MAGAVVRKIILGVILFLPTSNTKSEFENIVTKSVVSRLHLKSQMALFLFNVPLARKIYNSRIIIAINNHTSFL